MKKRHLLLILFCSALIISCTEEREEVHFFLDGYPELQFLDIRGNPVPTEFFVRHENQNGMSVYEIQDITLNLVYRKTKDPYSGFIRTYHWGVYNIEAVFKNGSIERLRYWHPNRQLAMDRDYLTGNGNVWTSEGKLSITWEEGETQFRNTSTGKIKSLHNDTVSYFFDYDGNLSHYSSRTDTAFMQYYADGSPRYIFPISNNGSLNGLVKRWHPNGQLQAIGKYVDGEESGTWIEYDSLGNVLGQVDYN